MHMIYNSLLVVTEGFLICIDVKIISFTQHSLIMLTQASKTLADLPPSTTPSSTNPTPLPRHPLSQPRLPPTSAAKYRSIGSMSPGSYSKISLIPMRNSLSSTTSSSHSDKCFSSASHLQRGRRSRAWSKRWRRRVSWVSRP